MGEIIERIPHKSVAYAFIEVRASSANEFESLRAEALKRAPHYGFAEQAPAEPKPVAAVEVAVTAEEEPVATQAAQAEADQASAAAAPTSTAGLSPREIARQKMAAKKGA